MLKRVCISVWIFVETFKDVEILLFFAFAFYFLPQAYWLMNQIHQILRFVKRKISTRQRIRTLIEPVKGADKISFKNVVFPTPMFPSTLSVIP